MEEAEGRKIVEELRAAIVARQYRFETISTAPLVVKCSHPTERRRSYALVMTAGGLLCSCPVCTSSLAGGIGAATCKHIQGWAILQAEEEAAIKAKTAAVDAVCAKVAKIAAPAAAVLTYQVGREW